MGCLIYHDGARVSVPDHALSHLQIVMLAMLARGIAFEFSWETGWGTATARQSMWITPGTTLEFRYDSDTVSETNWAWIDALLFAAKGPDGLRLLTEPDASTLPGFTGTDLSALSGDD